MKLILLLVILTTSLVSSFPPGNSTSAYFTTDSSTANSPTFPITANSSTAKSTANTTIDFPSQEFGGGFVGQTYMQFITNRTRDLKAPIQKLLLNAQAYSLNVTLIGACNSTIKWRIGKCEAAFFREETAVRNFSLLWTSATIGYLLKATREECFGNFHSDGTTSGWSRVETNDPRFFFFSPISRPRSSYWLFVIIGVAVIFVIMGIVFGHMMNSDGLGDDVASDIVMVPGGGSKNSENETDSGFDLDLVIRHDNTDNVEGTDVE
ncbi:hypothetical protein CAEBREN_18520 [Caenorhabditis brenneri]|uniref:Uncharacterized protein n=1 Tax=Caenorhabditis brenneri TaxID=135651 RepID=G0MYH7_CAEBE|nr:hypothetical protein CAEBREN_18520 [Caenorhabditis brenneri]